MMRRIGFVSALLLVPILVCQDASGKWKDGRSSNSVFVGAGILWPVGDWTGHRFAQGVNQFQRGLAFGFDFEHRFSESASLSLTGGYGSLDVSDWENYARSRGDNIDGSAYMLYGGLRLSFYIFNHQPNTLKMGVGVLYLGTYGHEQFKSFAYDYDFLPGSSVALLTGVEYEWSVNDSFALTARADLVVTPSGVKYVDGKEYSIYGIPTTLGVRFYL